MNNYTLTFNGDTPAALFAEVRDFCTLLDAGKAPAPAVSENVVVPARPTTAAPVSTTPAPAVPTTTTASPIPAPAPAVTTVAAAVPTVPAAIPTASIPTAAAPAYTLDQLGRATCVLSDANRVDEIRALFAQFGIAKLDELPPAQYGAYATALRQMGVTI